MGTTATLARHDSDRPGEPSWRLYEELFETGAVYLELRGVGVELETLETGGAAVVLRLPIATAEQLGLSSTVPPNKWARATDNEKW